MVNRVYHLDRGFEALERSSVCGADRTDFVGRLASSRRLDACVTHGAGQHWLTMAGLRPAVTFDTSPINLHDLASISQKITAARSSL